MIQLCPVQCCSFLIDIGIIIKSLMCLSFSPFLSALCPGMSSKEIYGNSCFGISYIVLGIFWFLYNTGLRTSRQWRKLLKCMFAPALLSLYKTDFVNEQLQYKEVICLLGSNPSWNLQFIYMFLYNL